MKAHLAFRESFVMRRTLLSSFLCISMLGCADADPSLEGLDESPVLAAEGPWIDDPIAPPDAGKAGLGEPGDERTSPWLDPELPASSGTSAAARGVRYDFESGSEGWNRSGPPITRVTVSGAQVVSGRESLALDVDGAGTALVSVSNPAVRPGATVTFHVFVPAGAQLTFVQPYVQQGADANWLWTGNWQPLSALRTNAWNKLTVVAPRNARAFAVLGVQLGVKDTWRGRVYVDAISF